MHAVARGAEPWTAAALAGGSRHSRACKTAISTTSAAQCTGAPILRGLSSFLMRSFSSRFCSSLHSAAAAASAAYFYIQMVQLS